MVSVFSEIDVHFLNEPSFFTFFAPLTCLARRCLARCRENGPQRQAKHAWITSPLSYFCLAQRDTRSLKKIRALACPLFEISTVTGYVHDVGLCTASTISQARQPCRLITYWPARSICISKKFETRIETRGRAARLLRSHAAPPRFAWRAPRRAAASRQQGLTTLGNIARQTTTALDRVAFTLTRALRARSVRNA